MVEPAPGLPLRTLITVRGNTTLVTEHAGKVHEVPCHEGGVALGEFILCFAPSSLPVIRQPPTLP